MRKKLFTFLLALVTSVGLLNAQSGGISVTKFNVPDDWESAEAPLLESDLPGFGAADSYTTQRWNEVPSGEVYLIYAFESDGRAKYHMFSNGVRYSSPTKDIWKPEIFSESNNGTKFYYTTGPSNWGPEQLPQVSEITNPPSEWYQDNTYISTDEMPGFATVDDETVKAWDGAPQGSAILISSVGNEFKYHNFRDGVYQYTMDDPLTRNTIYFNITDTEIAGRFFYTTGTIPGGSTPAVDPTPTPSGLQVTELQVVPGSWQDNPTMLSTSDMPGFSAVSYAEAVAWDAAPAGDVVLIFAFEENAATSLYFKNGVYQATQAYNITYEDVYAWYSLGEQIFYTGGGSTPATGLQVVEVTSDMYAGWNSNSNQFTVNALPGFQAVTFDEAKAWTEVPTSGTAVLVYRTNGDYARVIQFFDGDIMGDYDLETSFNQMYENITIFGNRIFYTAGGGSTPEPSETTVTWDLSDMASMGTQGGYFKAKGITLMAYGVDNGMSGDGSYGGAFFGGPFVFTTSLGKFTKIEVTNSYLYEQPAFSGDGWTLDGTNAVWEGTPAALVSLVSNFGGITQIKFTIDPNTSTPANSCGDGLTWAVNDGVLTISYDGVGTGSMDNYDDPLSMPWFGQNITSVVLPEGLISIGQNAFAFINTFSQITLPSTLQYILMNAFSGCGLTSVTIPENVKGISASAFISSSSLATVTFEPTTPPRVGGNAFEYCNNDLIIYYPCESRAQYYKDMQADIAYYHDKMNNCPAPPSNLHVTELEPPASWSGKSTYLAVADMPGFEETDAELAKTWEAPTNCNSILIYHVTEQYGDDRMYYHYFNAGNFVASEDGWYDLGTVYSNANSGIKTFYTSSGGGSSTPEIKLNANFGGDWADTEAFTDNGDGTATLSNIALEAGYYYNFRVKVDGVSMSDNHEFTRENPSYVISSGSGDVYYFQADVTGNYSFTWEYATNTLTIGYPAVAPDPTPTPSATGVIFANCYDCWRSPDYPNISGQCYLYNFGNPGVGNGNPSGPWKLEFVENYNSSSTEYDSGIVKSDVAISEYGKNPAEMEVYRLYQWQNGAYQPVAYGVLYAYANESNPVEHAAFFEASGYWGCYLTDNTHSSGDNFNILFNEDASTGFADLHDGSTNPEIKLYANFSGDWADTEAFTDNGNGTATLTIPSLEAKHNAIFVKKDGVEMSSGHNFTRENPSADVSGNQLAMWFDTDEAGEYTFTFEYSTNILTITYPTATPTPTPSDDANKLPGAFSVSGTKVVYFSKANLQATTADNGATWTWGFAEHQYDFVGNAVANNAINGGGTISENGAVDLFGWSSNANDYYGIDNSMSVDDYSGNFQDWGAKVGSDWHALNGAQWEYLLLTREPGSSAGGTSNPRFTRATILTDGAAPYQDIFGLILFPDNFNDGGEYIEGVTWNGINSHSSYASPTYCTTAGWATLESMGCVFLPAPGWRSGNEVTNEGAFGIYWSSTKDSEENASCIYFSNTDVAAFHSYITTGASVRLVSETAPSPAPTSFTFPAGTTIYYDFTAYGNGINVYAPGVPTDWYSSSANIIPVTLSSDWEISESTNLFKSEASGWNFVNGTILPTDGQNMIVSTNGVDYAWGTHVPAYTVAGEPAVAFGTPTWAPTNTDNDMVKQSNGTYKWEKEDVELAKDAVVSFKVCQDHGWDVAYPNDNFNHTILADGIYTLTITFDPNAEGDKVAINALKTADVVVAQTAEMKGFGDWNTGIALENINEGAAARVTKNLAAGDHEFKMIINDGWRGKVGATITRANNTVAEIVDNPNESNITLTADIPGDYIFTWTYAENTLSVEFPSLVVYVQNLIAAVGEVTLESGDAINAARTAYDALSAGDKEAVSNYDVLTDAEAAYAALAQAAADQLAANNVKNLIDAIDNPVVYTNDCKAKIDAARAAYDALTEAQKTLVGDEYAQKLADAEAAYDAFIVYTVAGEPEALFGSFWNIGDSNNDMVKQSNGTYKWEKSEVALAAGIAKFKIIKDHVTYEYPTSNYELQIEEDGIYTVTIIYNPKAAEDRITTNALKTGEVVIVHTAEMKGSWNNWTDGLELENINEGAAARATKILTPGTYEFKMIIDGSWLGEASTTFTRNENAKAEIGGDEDNLNLNADIPGCYTFTWTYETNTLEIGYPSYIDADFAIDFRTNPYSVVSGVEQSAGVAVEGTFNDTQHGYRLPVVTIPVTAGNYLVKMGTCKYSNQDGAIKNEDGSVTYATLATNTGVCYDANPATNYVAAIITVPSDQIIKVYGAEYTPFFSIEKMAAVPAFTDFELNFQTNPYNEISGAKPEGTVIAGSFHDGDHGYQNVEVTVPMEAGKYRLTLGACQFGNGEGNVMSETNIELASFDQNLGENKCYHQNPAENIISMIFDVDQDQTITIDCGQYTPYMKLEAVTSYAVEFALGDAEGTAPTAVDVTIGENITMPVNKTMYKDGYTLTGWSDGVNTYPIGESFTPANDVVLTPVFTANEADLLNATTDVTVKWYFGGDNGAPVMHLEGSAGLLVAQATIGDKTVDVKLSIDATSGKFVPQPTTEWAQVRVGTIFTYPYKEGMTVDVHTYSGNVTYYIADGNVTCGTNDYYSFIEVTYPASAPTTAVVIGDPNNASEVEAFLTNNDGQTIDELIIDRPVLNNMYNTLCLPFDMNATQIAASSLNGVEIREFTGASVEGTTLNLSVGDPVNAVVAGRPYFVKYSAASQLDDLHFEDVTINNALLDNMAVTFDGVTFKGTFTPFVMQNGLNFQGGYLFLGQNNQLFWPNTSNPLKPFRAYFYVDVESSTPGNAPKYRGMPARIVEGKNVATGVENAQSANQSTKVIVNGQLIIIKNDVRYNAQGQIVK